MEVKIFKYNWEGLVKASKYLDGSIKCKTIMSLIGILSLHKKNFSRAHYEQALKINALEKSSFILRIDDLLDNSRSTEQDKCIVLFLASKRNYLAYIEHKDSSLPIMIVEDIIDVDKLNNNPLLQVEGDIIKFNIN